MRDEKRSENCMWAQAIEGDVEDNVEDNEGRDKKFFFFFLFLKRYVTVHPYISIDFLVCVVY